MSARASVPAPRRVADADGRHPARSGSQAARRLSPRATDDWSAARSCHQKNARSRLRAATSLPRHVQGSNSVVKVTAIAGAMTAAPRPDAALADAADERGRRSPRPPPIRHQQHDAPARDTIETKQTGDQTSCSAGEMAKKITKSCASGSTGGPKDDRRIFRVRPNQPELTTTSTTMPEIANSKPPKQSDPMQRPVAQIRDRRPWRPAPGLSRASAKSDTQRQHDDHQQREQRIERHQRAPSALGRQRKSGDQHQQADRGWDCQQQESGFDRPLRTTRCDGPAP